MASNNSNFSVYSESATRAPVVPQLATGVDRHSADDQGRAQSATGIESDLQARSGGMDLESCILSIFILIILYFIDYTLFYLNYFIFSKL